MLNWACTAVPRSDGRPMIDDFLNETFTIQRVTKTPDQFGTIVETWNDLLTTPGRQVCKDNWERVPIQIDFGRQEMLLIHVLYLPFISDPAAHEQPWIKITDRAVDSKGTILHFRDVTDPGFMHEHLEVMCWLEEA